MIKITFFLMLAMLWSEAAFAVVYQCRDQKGNIFLTNDRSKFPPGCEQFGETYGEQPPPPPAVTPPAATRRSEPAMSERRRTLSPPPAAAPPAAAEPPAAAAPSPAQAPATETGAPEEDEE